MEKHILIIIFIAITSFSNAQRNIEIAFKPGVSIPKLTAAGSNNPVSSGYRTLPYQDAALHVEITANKSLSIQPQLEYSIQGGKKNGVQAFKTPDITAPQFAPGAVPSFLYADYKRETRITYFILPIFIKYHFIPQKNKWRAYIAAGPFASYLLNAKNITTGYSMVYLDKEKTQPLGQAPQSFDNENHISRDFHRFNTGITGHLGLGYKIVTGSIFLEVGGNYGFVVIQKNSVNGRNRTGAAVINLGYQYEL
ncbi:PorT family protein [Niabella sp. CC-SYL272]|uniref:porin family protein n=1 Tax=Niabella agricola TaxID=2891571 RepID=UPI001F26B97D|nr:porin family protein [Niabella agricola]MCF3107680.1 PorT family protein [Niabella agricola]